MKLRMIAVLLVGLMLLSSTTFAQEMSAIPSVTVTADADGLVLPDDIPSGLVTVVYENLGEGPLFPVLARLNDGKTMDDFMTVLFEESDPSSVVTLKGGAFVFPQASGSVTYNLTSGEYVLANFGGEEPQLATFTIAADDAPDMDEPEAEVTVGLFDFAFGIPLEIPAGENVWKIENFGMQWHEMAVFPVDSNMSIQQIRTMLMDESEESLPAFVWTPSGVGETAWVTVTLEPGTYVVACFLTDVSDGGQGRLHHEEGMMQVITVE